MKLFLYSYIGALLFTGIGERIIGGSSSLHFTLTMIGLGLSLFSIIQAWKTSSRSTVLFAITGFLGLCFSIIGGQTGQELFQVSDDNLQLWFVFFQSLGVLCIFSSLLPLFALHHLFSLGEKHATAKRANQLSKLWLGTAFAILSMLPINYIATENNIRWDLGYFKTATPGESSLSLADNLTEQVTVYLFFRIGMDVTEEIRGYFDQLPTKNLNIIYVDKDKEPELAKELGIRENGMIALVKGDGSEKQIKRISVGKDFSSAKRILRKLDETFRENLLKLTEDASVLYFTNGHGEMHWKSDKDADPNRQISMLKKGLRTANFTIKELNISNGLANEIPSDAKAVVILAPQLEFTEAEITTLFEYWQQGNSLFIALEPDGDTLAPLLDKMGLSYDNTPLSHSNIFMPTSRRATISDQRNIVTNKFSTHPSVTTLSRYNKVMQLVFSSTGSLTAKDTNFKTKAVIKSLENTWKDQNSNYKRDPAENEDIWNIAMTIEHPIDETTAKAIVFADASWLNDNYLAKGFSMGKQTIQPHAVTLSDTLLWLTEREEARGTVNNEQDIKIQHSKEGQGWIFFSFSVFIPMGIFGLGLIRIRRRKQGS